VKVSGILFRFVLSATLPAGLLATVSGAPAVIAQGPAVTSNLDGIWANVDPRTRGLVRIEIHGKKIHPYGACHPNPCDWGVLKAKSFAANVDSAIATALVAKYNTNFSRAEITLALEADGRLRAEVFTHFTDGSGRADFREVDSLERVRPEYAP
jgi:hypothetical protein